MANTRKHGCGNNPTPEYRAWAAAKSRCYNKNHPDYARYGGRGISMCKEWCQNYLSFLAHIGPRPSAKHSLDRFPNKDGNYEPSNVRWATAKEQSNNRNYPNSRNHKGYRYITYNGETLSLAQWSRKLGINYTTISSRLIRNHSIEKVLSKERI